MPLKNNPNSQLKKSPSTIPTRNKEQIQEIVLQNKTQLLSKTLNNLLSISEIYLPPEQKQKLKKDLVKITQLYRELCLKCKSPATKRIIQKKLAKAHKAFVSLLPNYAKLPASRKYKIQSEFSHPLIAPYYQALSILAKTGNTLSNIHQAKKHLIEFFVNNPHNLTIAPKAKKFLTQIFDVEVKNIKFILQNNQAKTLNQSEKTKLEQTRQVLNLLQKLFKQGKIKSLEEGLKLIQSNQFLSTNPRLEQLTIAYKTIKNSPYDAISQFLKIERLLGTGKKTQTIQVAKLHAKHGFKNTAKLLYDNYFLKYYEQMETLVDFQHFKDLVLKRASRNSPISRTIRRSIARQNKLHPNQNNQEIVLQAYYQVLLKLFTNRHFQFKEPNSKSAKIWNEYSKALLSKERRIYSSLSRLVNLESHFPKTSPPSHAQSSSTKQKKIDLQDKDASNAEQRKLIKKLTALSITQKPHPGDLEKLRKKVKENRKYYEKNLWKLFLDTEKLYLGRKIPSKQLEKKFQALLSKLKRKKQEIFARRNLSKNQKTFQTLQYMLDIQSRYFDQQAMFSYLLDGVGGNCEAKTKLGVALVQKLFPNLEVKVQKFSDHIQLIVRIANSWYRVYGQTVVEQTSKDLAGTLLHDPKFFIDVFLGNPIKGRLIPAINTPSNKGGGISNTNLDMKTKHQLRSFQSGPNPEIIEYSKLKEYRTEYNTVNEWWNLKIIERMYKNTVIPSILSEHRNNRCFTIDGHKFTEKEAISFWHAAFAIAGAPGNFLKTHKPIIQVTKVTLPDGNQITIKVPQINAAAPSTAKYEDKETFTTLVRTVNQLLLYKKFLSIMAKAPSSVMAKKLIKAYPNKQYLPLSTFLLNKFYLKQAIRPESKIKQKEAKKLNISSPTKFKNDLNNKINKLIQRTIGKNERLYFSAGLNQIFQLIAGFGKLAWSISKQNIPNQYRDAALSIIMEKYLTLKTAITSIKSKKFKKADQPALQGIKPSGTMQSISLIVSVTDDRNELSHKIWRQYMRVFRSISYLQSGKLNSNPAKNRTSKKLAKLTRLLKASQYSRRLVTLKKILRDITAEDLKKALGNNPLTVNNLKAAVWRTTPDIDHSWWYKVHTPVASLEMASKFKNITRIRLNNTTASDEGVKHLAKLKNLTSISLDDTKVSDEGVKHLANLKSLKQISLKNTKVSDEGIKHLLKLKNLTSIDLDGTKVSDEGVKHLAKLKNLTGISLGDTKVSDEGVKHLAKIKSLKRIGLDNTKVSDEGVKYLAKIKSLEQISLKNTKVSDEGVKHLAKIKSLKRIWLSNTNVSDEGVKHLAKLKNLNYIDLNGTKVSDEGVKPLAKLKKLGQIWFEDTKISNKAITYFNSQGVTVNGVETITFTKVYN